MIETTNTLHKTNELCGWRDCATTAVGRVQAFENRILVGDIVLCEPHIDEVVRGYRHSRVGLGKAERDGSLRTCEVETLVSRLDRRVGHVVLRECEGKRHFVIELNDCDLTTLAWNMRKLSPLPLPTTHAAVAELLQMLGAKLQAVRVHERAKAQGQMFYRVKLLLEQNLRSIEYVVRPTDALNLAHLFGVPIFVAEEFLC